MKPGKYDFFRIFVKEDDINFVGYFENAKVKLKAYHSTIMEALHHSPWQQSTYDGFIYFWQVINFIVNTLNFLLEIKTEKLLFSFVYTVASLSHKTNSLNLSFCQKQVLSYLVTAWIWGSFAGASFLKYCTVFLILINLLFSLSITHFLLPLSRT